MKMSEAKICDFYRFEAKDGYGRQAIESLAMINKCQIDEIVGILQENGLAMKYYEKQKQEEKPMARNGNPDKDNIIRDYNNGMTCKELGERYAQNPKVIYNNLKRWGIWRGAESKEKEPASAATDISSTKKSTNKSIPQKPEIVKPVETDGDDMVNWLSWLIDTARAGLDELYSKGDGTYSSGFHITAARAEREKQKAAVSFEADRKVYNLVLEVYAG